MIVINDSFMVCSDCLQAIANDDYSGLDYYLSPDQAERQANHIRESIATTEGIITIGDPDRDNEFSTLPCDCCNDHLAGSRHHCAILK